MTNRPLIPFILATAGHIDHGKSSLVKALTGIDPDRLPEEKRRGITIDLGFAHLELPSPPTVQPAADYSIGIIDVPGHEHFVKNMVAGVGSIDAALLVVSADDGWMPQTQEHFHILQYLGVTRGIIALTKIDKVVDETSAIELIRHHLAGTPFSDAIIVPTSIVSGRGIDVLKIELSRLFAATPPQPDIGKARLPVDRVFSLKGIGTVVTGTLTGGELRTGQSVCIQPTNTPARIRSMQTHNREVAVGRPGSRIAINLPDIHPAPERARRPANSIARGDVVTLAETGDPTLVFDALVERLGDETLSRSLRRGSTVRVHHGSSSTAARIAFFEVRTLETPGRALARLTLELPILAFAGDRFVIRDWPEQRTLAGGVILDVQPSPSRKQRPKAGSASMNLLEARAAAPNDAMVFVRSQVDRDGVVLRAALLRQSRFSDADVERAVGALLAGGGVVTSGDLLASAQVWSACLERAAREVDEHHRAHPEVDGLPIASLRSALSPINTQAIDAVIEAMCRDGFVRRGTVIGRASHAITLPARLQQAGARIRQQLNDHPFDPPSKKELCADDVSNQAMKFLIASGEVIAISPDLVMSTAPFKRAVEQIRAHLASHGSATVSELKSLLGSSRRVMVPLLEKLDRDKITSREGDLRRLSGAAASTKAVQLRRG